MAVVHDHTARHALAHMIAAVAAIIFALSFLLLTIWLVFAKQDSKLYEADNVVCASQPFAIQCFERKPR